MQATISAQGIQNAAQRSAATQQALIQFGAVPDFSGLGLSQDQMNYLGQDLTPDVSALAQQNTTNGLSTEAQLQQHQAQSVMALKQALAARGGLSSGEANYQMNNEQQSYAQAQAQAVQTLLAAIGGYQNTYVTGQQSGESQLSQGLDAAYTRQSQLPQNQVTPASSFAYNPQTGQYTGASGSYTPYNLGSGGFVVVNNQTGQAYTLNADGSIGAQTNYTPPTAAAPVPSSLQPHAASALASPTGASSNAQQGVFSLH